MFRFWLSPLLPASERTLACLWGQVWPGEELGVKDWCLVKELQVLVVVTLLTCCLQLTHLSGLALLHYSCVDNFSSSEK